MIIRPVKLTVSLTTSTTRSALYFTMYLYRGAKPPLYNYVIKYKALLVDDVVKLTVSLTGLIIMLTKPFHANHAN